MEDISFDKFDAINQTEWDKPIEQRMCEELERDNRTVPGY